MNHVLFHLIKKSFKNFQQYHDFTRKNDGFETNYRYQSAILTFPVIYHKTLLKTDGEGWEREKTRFLGLGQKDLPEI